MFPTYIIYNLWTKICTQQWITFKSWYHIPVMLHTIIILITIIMIQYFFRYYICCCIFWDTEFMKFPLVEMTFESHSRSSLMTFCRYTPWATLVLIIILAFLGRFLYILHQWKQEGILYKAVNKIYHFTLCLHTIWQTKMTL